MKILEVFHVPVLLSGHYENDLTLKVDPNSANESKSLIQEVYDLTFIK